MCKSFAGSGILSKIYVNKKPSFVACAPLLFSLWSVGLCSISAQADDDTAVEGNVDKPEATIWLEEKIAPSSRWMEELVRPMTNWMEERLHGEPRPADRPVSKSREPVENSDHSLNTPIIKRGKAIEIARSRFPGEVLHVKLLSASQRYRIKLLTAEGVIHVVYIDAVRATLLNQDQE